MISPKWIGIDGQAISSGIQIGPIDQRGGDDVYQHADHQKNQVDHQKEGSAGDRGPSLASVIFARIDLSVRYNAKQAAPPLSSYLKRLVLN